MSAGGNKGVKSEINVTPLVDVVLVLLIIFMLVTPMLQRGKDVQLPKSRTTEPEAKDADPIILSITPPPDKRVYIENDPFDEPSLEKALKTRLEATPGRKLLLKGDQTLNVGDVRHVMEIARKAGAKAIALGVEEIKN